VDHGSRGPNGGTMGRSPQFSGSMALAVSRTRVSTDASGGPLNLMMRGDGQEMKQLIEVLSQFNGRAVRDKTGLTGRYDFAMKLDLQMVLALAQKMGTNVPAAAANIPQADGSSLMTRSTNNSGSSWNRRALQSTWW
jgi:uncharacterized protein (TIGR03435 family)